MAGTTGRWKLVNSNNLEAYHNAINTTEEYKEKLRALAAELKKNPDVYVEEFTYDASEGTVQRVLFIAGEKKRDTKYKVGVESDGTSPDGRKVKVTLGLEGNNKVTIHEKGEGFEINGFVEAKGSDLTLSLTGNGVTSVQTYTKI